MFPGLALQISEWLLEGAAARIVGRTAFNPRSSRSHAVSWNNSLLGSKLIAAMLAPTFPCDARLLHLRWLRSMSAGNQILAHLRKEGPGN